MTELDAEEFLNTKKRNIRDSYKDARKYRASIEMAIFALNKRNPEKPPYGLNICPDCYQKQSFFKPKSGVRYCPFCGKAINWDG